MLKRLTVSRSSQRDALLARDGHLADEHRAYADAAARVDVAAECDDVAIHGPEVPGDRDLVHGIGQMSVFHPEAARTARVVASHTVDALSHELGHQQTRAELREQRLPVDATLRGGDQQVMNPADI